MQHLELNTALFDRILFPILSKDLPFPLSYVVPYRDRYRTISSLHAMRIVTGDEIKSECIDALDAITLQLSDKLYLFGIE